MLHTRHGLLSVTLESVGVATSYSNAPGPKHDGIPRFLPARERHFPANAARRPKTRNSEARAQLVNPSTEQQARGAPNAR